MEDASKAIETGFSILYSTPLTIAFLSTLNYFTLSSLYVLLNIRLPYAIFYYFETFFYTSQANILQTFDTAPQIDPPST
jgi:hypothetical protein